jgi:hypothetical protein
VTLKRQSRVTNQSDICQSDTEVTEVTLIWAPGQCVLKIGPIWDSVFAGEKGRSREYLKEQNLFLDFFFFLFLFPRR